ncbi:MAG: hypothetical protein ACOCUI_01215 [bacterium]
MRVKLYNWKKSIWVIFDPTRKPGDGTKPQETFLYGLYPIYNYLKNNNSIGFKSKNLNLYISEKKFSQAQIHLKLSNLLKNDVLYINTTINIQPFGLDKDELNKIFKKIPKDIYLELV